MSGVAWTAEQDKIITDMRGVLSASQIGAMIGRARCAVIGRSHRLGLPKQVRPARAPIKTVRKRSGKIAKVPFVREFASPPVPVAPLNIPFADLQSFHCREIVENDGLGNSLSCGHTTVHETSWCQWHFSTNTQQGRARRASGWYYQRAA